MAQKTSNRSIIPPEDLGGDSVLPPPTFYQPGLRNVIAGAVDEGGRVSQLESSAQDQATSTPDSQAILGPRTDLPSGRGVRVRWGKLSDGTYGIERFTSAGVRQVPTWS